MGSSGGGTQVVKAEEVVTPAVARSISANTESAQQMQGAARERLRGIRSTYSRFTNGGTAAGGNGSSQKLG